MSSDDRPIQSCPIGRPGRGAPYKWASGKS